jgi:hypothetical protein
MYVLYGLRFEMRMSLRIYRVEVEVVEIEIEIESPLPALERNYFAFLHRRAATRHSLYGRDATNATRKFLFT